MEVRGFIKKEFLLVISAILALFSLLIVPFDTVLSYDYSRIVKTMFTLLFFMLIVAGLKECRTLDLLAHKTLKNHRDTRSLSIALVLLPFFCAMLFSNDVSLLTFVPLSIAILSMADQKKLIPIVIVLQTAAANIGSSLTPFGNPHNIYIYNLHDVYGFSLMEYEIALIPMVLIGAVVILAFTALIPKREIAFAFDDEPKIEHGPRLYVILVLLIIAVLSVLGIIPYYIAALVIIAAFLVIMPKTFKEVDYSILFVFFFLFVFSNGITNLDPVHSFISGLMETDPMLTTVFVSQFTSNVPATILLQMYTSDWSAVLVGADIGGFGTPIASMAALITLRLYMLEEDHDLKRYFKIFFLINLVMLAVQIPLYYLYN